MTQPEATAEAAIARLETRLAELHKLALLSDVRDSLEDHSSALATLPGRLAALRTRGYVYHASMEARLEALRTAWPRVYGEAQAAIAHQTQVLRPEAERAERAVRALQPSRTQLLTVAQPALGLAEAVLASTERQVQAAQEAIRGMFDSYGNELSTLTKECGACEQCMTWLEAASFALAPGEALVAATEAHRLQESDRVPGVLFVSDQRLVFERREKVAKKKVLFITTASELVKEVTWQSPLAALEGLEASEARKALVFKRELLAVRPRGGSGAAPTQFELETDSDAFRTLLLRCQSGEIAAERVGGAAAVPEYIIPAKCPSCGGALARAGRVRGITSYTCDFCGAAIPLQPA